MPEASSEIWQTLGYSVEGRPIRACTVGHGPARVLWIGGIHGNEVEGQVATAKLPEALQHHGLLAFVQLTVVEDLNPDGRAHGTRRNARGVDLNRNWPTRNFRESAKNGPHPLSEPEAQALMGGMARFSPELIWVAHSSTRVDRVPFINFDGPAEPLAARFRDHAGWRMEASDALHPTPGSLGTHFGIEQQIPVLTLEWRRGEAPDKAWKDTEMAIVEVLRWMVQSR